MSSEQTFSTSDLRSTAQDNKRDAARKHKWALGAVETVTRAGQKPRPHRPHETEYNSKRRETKGAVAAFQNGTKVTRKCDMLEGVTFTDDSSNTNSDHDETSPPSPHADAGVMYSFDAARAPSEGSQILNVALAKAMEKFEERETVKLIKNEYDVLDTAGESVRLSPVRKGKGKLKSEVVVAADEEDYEFV